MTIGPIGHTPPITGSPLAASAPASGPVSPPPVPGDRVSMGPKAGKGIPNVALLPTEEPDRKHGVTFKSMLKSAREAASQGYTDNAVALFDRSIHLASDVGDLAKVIRSAEDQVYLPVVDRALLKGLLIADRPGDLLDLAAMAHSRGMTPITEELLNKAVAVADKAKTLRQVASVATDYKLPQIAKRAYHRIAALPPGRS